MCRVRLCEIPAPKKSKTGLCRNCTSSLYYWTHKRKPHHMVLRQQKLKLYLNRVNLFSTPDKLKKKLGNGGTNVVPFKRRA